MKRKYDLVSNLYLDLFEKRDNYQNHIRALSTSSSVIEDKKPEPPARLRSRKNSYMEIQKKFYQLGVENTKAVSSLSNYSKYKNPAIIEPRSNINSNKPARIDWMKPYNSTPLPPLKPNQIFFKKNHKSVQPYLIEGKKRSNKDLNKTPDNDNKYANNNSIENNDLELQKNKDVNNGKQIKTKKRDDIIDKNDTILYLTEPDTKDLGKLSETRKESTLENTITSVTNKLTSDIDNDINLSANFERSETNKSEKDFSDEFEDDFDKDEENNEMDSSTSEKDEDSDEKESDDFGKNENNKSSMDKFINKNENTHEGKIEMTINNNSNLLLENKNESETFEDIEMEKGKSETEEFNSKDSELSKEEENNDNNEFEFENDSSEKKKDDDDDEFENFEIE